MKFVVVFTHILHKNLKTLGGIHEVRKIKKLKPILVPRLGPRTSAPASAPRFALRSGLRSGPRAQPRHQMGFNIFDFRTSWNHPRFQVFMQKYAWNHQKIPKKIWNRTKKKKKSGFYLKPHFSHFWSQNNNLNTNLVRSCGSLNYQAWS